MSLMPTNLYIQAAQLPATFRGTPNDLFTAMVQRMKIVSPSGVNFIYIGDSEPTSNVGPWLRGGTKWYVWDESTKRYVPVDVSDSVDIPFWIGATTPASTPPMVWLKTSADATDLAPYSYGQPVGWYFFDGSAWVPYVGIVLSGPTASRPTSPATYQMYFDTTITVLLWYERSAWRTVSGVPGDIKHVSFQTLAEALEHNPGWEVLGASNQALRGRYIIQAAADPGGANPLAVDTDVEVRNAFTAYGEDTTLTLGASAVTYPPTIAFWTLVKT